MSHHAPAGPSPSARRPWSPWAWVGLVAAVLVEAVAALAVAFFIQFGDSTTCNDTASSAQVVSGERDALVALLVALLPWVLLTALRPERLRFAMAGVVAASPLVLLVLVGLNPDTWRGSFCF